MNTRKQQLFLMLVIGVLIGTSIMLVWYTRGVGGDKANASTPSGATTTKMQVSTSTETLSRVPNLPAAPEIPQNLRLGLNVSDQPAGSSVFVAGMAIKEPRWVAVYEDRDGRPGNILGASHVFAGYISTLVELLRNTESGKTYYVAILNDNGDDEFDRLMDLPPFSKDNIVIVSFKAQ